MCGRFAAGEPRLDAAEWFSIRESGLRQIEPRYNVAPSLPIVVIQPDRDGGRRADVLRWGLKAGGKVPNLRGDSTDKPWARTLLRSRCVIPATGFYEWQPAASGRGRKQPFYFEPAQHPAIAFAAVVGAWEGVGVALFTAGANDLMAPIHDRMPVLLDQQGMALWLDPQASMPEVLALLRPAPDDWLHVRPVGLAVSNSRNEGAQLIEPVEPAG